MCLADDRSIRTTSAPNQMQAGAGTRSLAVRARARAAVKRQRPTTIVTSPPFCHPVAFENPRTAYRHTSPAGIGYGMQRPLSVGVFDAVPARRCRNQATALSRSAKSTEVRVATAATSAARKTVAIGTPVVRRDERHRASRREADLLEPEDDDHGRWSNGRTCPSADIGEVDVHASRRIFVR
jgi:hypothetical protein